MYALRIFKKKWHGLLTFEYLSMISSKLPFESSSIENGKYSIAERKILYLTCTLFPSKKRQTLAHQHSIQTGSKLTKMIIQEIFLPVQHAPHRRRLHKAIKEYSCM